MFLNKKIIFSLLFLSLAAGAGILFLNPESQLKPPPRISHFLQRPNSNFIDIEIVPGTPADNDSQLVRITATVTPKNLESNLEYAWRFGENVELVRGEKSGTIQNLNEELQIEIFVRGFNSKENRHIQLQARGVKFGQKIVTEKLIASNAANSFEHIVQNVEKIKAEEKK